MTGGCMKKRMTGFSVLFGCALFFALAGAGAQEGVEVHARSNEPDGASDDRRVSATVTVTPEAGGSARVGLAEISVPPGAVREAMEITVTMLPATESLGEGLSNATAGAAGYRFSPRGATFDVPVEVRIGYDPSLGTRPGALEDLYTYFFDETRSRWTALERVGFDRERAMLISRTTHFTDMVNATLSLPEAPERVSFNVNSIKSLAAADPNAGIPEFDGLEANSLGTASFGIPLELPGGRAGMKPDIALAYSSEGGSGLAGRGFDLRAGGAITIDTRNGLPSYTHEDSYLLDGEKLEAVPGQSPAPGPRSAEIEYRPRSNRSFERITRKLAVIGGIETTYWTVTDKTGRRRVYGLGSGWTGPDESRKFEWKLSREIDTFGNAIDYSYENREGENCAYLTRVSYTGRAHGEIPLPGDEPGPYSVELAWTETRLDRRSSARGAFLQRTVRELRSVTMSYAGTAAWSYELEYAHNENRHLILRSVAKKVGGREFWRYGFDYYGSGPTDTDADTEVDGFDEPVDWAIPASAGLTLSKTGSSGGGASLYLGLKFYIPYIFGRYVIASVGASVGVQTTATGTKTTMTDVDGDGLSDMVWQSESGVHYARNAGVGVDGTGSFEDAVSGMPLFPLTGKSLNKENQTTYSLSFSESLGPAAANLTEQWSDTASHGVFIDVDGDGFVDYLTSDDPYYRRNSHEGFARADWTEMEEGAEPSALFLKNRESFERTYYAQEPYILWRPEFEGTVVVTHRAALAHPESASADGASLDGYHARSGANGDTGVSRFGRILLSRAQPAGETGAELDVRVSDRLFFHFDAGDSCERDDADCSVAVSYRSVRPFAYIGESSSVMLEERVSSERARPELDSLYDCREIPGERGATYEYSLKPAWEELLQRDPGLATPLYLDGAYAIPRTIGEEAFFALAEAGSSDVRLRFHDGRKIAEERLPESRVLFSGYSYEGERGRFVRREEDGEVWRFVSQSNGSLNGSFVRDSAEGYLRRHRDALDDEAKLELARVPAPDTGAASIPYRKGNVSFVAGPAAERFLEARIDAVDRVGVVTDGEVRFADAEGLQCRVSGNEVFRLADGKESRIAATVECFGDILRVVTESSGILTVTTLTGKTSSLVSVDRATFEARVMPLMLERSRLDDDSARGLSGLFSFDGASYATRDGLDAEDLSLVAGLYAAAGLARYAACATRFVYSSEAEFAVETAADGSTGIRIPVVRDGAVSVLWKEIPGYDSAGDFTADDARGTDRMLERFALSSSTDIGDLGDEGGIGLAEYARGGNKGWYYGLWSGYYDFDPGKIGAEADRSRDVQSGRKPPYSRDIRKNENADGAPCIVRSARDHAVVLGTNALIGDVSVVSEPSLDWDLRTTVTETSYGTFFDGRRIHVERIGGTAYEMASNSRAGPDGEKPGVLVASASGATDVGASLGIAGLGGQISENKGSSWQYKGLMDMNGDRYPDMVQFDDDCDPGDFGFSVQPGNGFGFGPKRRYEGRLPAMTVTDNFGHGFGVSLNPGGFVSSKNDALGRQTGLVVAVGGCGDFPSIGISGTYGRSVVEAQFADMNGDGLPDQVARDGVGSFAVALNTGNGTFAPFENWGEGIVREMSNDLGVSVKSAGISTSRNASIGLPHPLGFLLGINVSVSSTTNETVSSLIDINGDGLPDHVYKRNGEPYFVARLNLGDSFDRNETRVRRPDWRDEEAMDRAIADSVGEGAGALTSSASGSLYDEAKDRQPAFEVDVGKMKDHPVARETALLSVKDVMESTSGVTYNAAISLDVVIRYYLLGIFITPGTSLNFGHTTSMMRFTDINGDGLPDHVRHVAGMPNAQVKLNSLGANGLLRAVRTPYGERIELEYSSAGNTVDMPQHRYVLGRVLRSSGFGEDGRPFIAVGPASFATEYSYEGGYYDRAEREFYGFRAVTERRAGDAGYSRTLYANDRYYRKGTVEETLRYRAPDELAARVKYEIDARYPRVTRETVTRYDADRGTELTTEVEYGYEEEDGSDFGNVTKMTDRGDVSHNADDFFVSLRHYRDMSRYIVSPVTSVVVTQGDRELRRRSGEYTAEGRLGRLTAYHEQGSGSSTTLTWDDFGNLLSVTDPAGTRSEYAYDPEARSFPVEVSIGGPGIRGRYSSRYTWDPLTGRKLSETDPGGGVMRYEYDSLDRLFRVWSPYDGAVTPAVEYRYYPSSEGTPGFAVARNKLVHDPDDESVMETVVAVDPLRRALFTAKRGSFRDGQGSEIVGWNVSGMTRYDEFGRAVEYGQNAFSRVEDVQSFASGDGYAEIARLYRDFVRPTRREYDSLDRIVTETFPDRTTVEYAYGIGNCRTPAEWTSVRDENGNSSVQYRDARGNVVKVERHSGAYEPMYPKEALTGATFEYDCLGQMLEARDFFGNPVTVGYDMLGRRTSIESADTGRREFSYDAAGNLVRETDSVLRGANAAVHYTYDGLGRLVHVDYPFSEDTEISYGGPDTGPDSGRKTLVRDESGHIVYSYGKLGEVVYERRMIKRLNVCDDGIVQEMRYEYDYLGRMRAITYPDEEVVTYSYDRGGLVSGVHGLKRGVRFDYVRFIGYDEFGQRSMIVYGNGVRTAYEYDKNRRWLSGLTTTEEAGDADGLYQKMSYGYDGVGNVTFVENDAFAAKTRQEYKYDGLDRLVRAEGASVSRPYLPVYSARYVQDYGYDAIGNLVSKKSVSSVNAAALSVRDLNYSFESSFDSGQFAHRAARSGDMHYSYDANGNLSLERRGEPSATGGAAGYSVERHGDSAYGADYGFALFEEDGREKPGGDARAFSWNERNLMRSSKDARSHVRYSYGHDGNRAVKNSSRGESLYYNGLWQITDSYDRELRQGKHVYVGETRVATKYGKRGDGSVSYESKNIYFYHADHLGSVQLVTDCAGQIYERVEYAPYGEIWIEEKAPYSTPFRFTGKEIDGETGLYYYGARYMDPKYSRWLSADPALGDYVPGAPVSEAVRERNKNLPGLGGFYNPVNFALYHYAGNNPVRYVDPDGRESADAAYSWNKYFQDAPKVQLPVKNARVTSRAGPRKVISTAAGNSSAVHKGWDIGPSEGKKTESYKPIAEGKIAQTGKSASVGNYTVVDHGNDWSSLYYHDDLPSLYNKGDKVTKETTIGSMGNSGVSNGIHLHLEIRKNNSPIDPAILFERDIVMYGRRK